MSHTGVASNNRSVSIEEALAVGQEHLQAGRLVQAQDIFSRILQVVPQNAQAMHLLATTFFQAGRLQDAIPLSRQAAGLMPQEAAVHYNLACMLSKEKLWDQAIESARRAADLNPDLLDAKSLLAKGLDNLDRHADAIVVWEDLTNRRPENSVYWVQLARSCGKVERFAQAAEAYERYLTIKPDAPNIWNELGWASINSYNVQRAVDAFRKAVELDPNNASIRHNYALTLRDNGDMDAASEQFSKSIELRPDDPEYHFSRSIHNLLRGNFAEGWKEFEWRWQVDDLKPLNGPHRPGVRWNGANPHGKRLLVLWEQGFGDMIQFGRYVSLLADLGAEVILVCPGKLGKLLVTLPGIHHLVEEGAALPPYDAYVWLMDLPGVLGTDLNSIPNTVPYIWSLKEESERWLKRLGDKDSFRVGLVWATNSKVKTRMRKSIPAQTVVDLLDVPGVTFYGLHVGASPEDLAILGPKIKDLSLELNDFSATAAVMDQMDLIITIDSAAAHLAGAMGKPVWILLHWSADWRWLLDRQDSPWYPTARLFRQSAPNDWKSLIAVVKQELISHLGSRVDRQR